MNHITPDSTLREIAAAAFEVGFRLTITPALLPTRADRLTAEYGPRGHCWRWEGPWRRFKVVFDDKNYEGWERFFSTPAYEDDGTALWDKRYGTWNVLNLFDNGETPWSNPYGLEQTA